MIASALDSLKYLNVHPGRRGDRSPIRVNHGFKVSIVGVNREEGSTVENTVV